MQASVLLKTERPADHPAREFACDVRAGLSKPQKELYSKYLYDDLGSSLFEAITHLPEYGLTRADERLLTQEAAAIAREVPSPASVVELGSGGGRKTRPILAALHALSPDLRYYPVDLSADALARCEREVQDLAEVHPLEQSYLEGLAAAAAERRPGETLLVMFLGSTLGNFERTCAAAFLRDVRRQLDPGDRFLVGADLVKDRERMLLAYDDPTGVTAAFNLNLLGRVNRELGGDFRLRNFEHEARWNEGSRRIEMHLRSRIDQLVHIADIDMVVRFRAGETIWTESSHKFQTFELQTLGEQAGFRVVSQWTDEEWPFAESLWSAL